MLRQVLSGEEGAGKWPSEYKAEKEAKQRAVDEAKKKADEAKAATKAAFK